MKRSASNFDVPQGVMCFQLLNRTIIFGQVLREQLLHVLRLSQRQCSSLSVTSNLHVEEALHGIFKLQVDQAFQRLSIIHSRL